MRKGWEVKRQRATGISTAQAAAELLAAAAGMIARLHRVIGVQDPENPSPQHSAGIRSGPRPTSILAKVYPVCGLA